MVVIYDALFDLGVWRDMDTLPDSYTYLTDSEQDLAIINKIQPIVVGLIDKAAQGMEPSDIRSAMMTIVEDGKPENANKPNNKAQALTVTLIDFVRLNLLKHIANLYLKKREQTHLMIGCSKPLMTIRKI